MTTMTSAELIAAKGQIAATKIAALQTVISDLQSSTVTFATLKVDLATALATLDTTDAAYQQTFNISNILNTAVTNLNSQLGPLQNIVTAAAAAAAAASTAAATTGGSS